MNMTYLYPAHLGNQSLSSPSLNQIVGCSIIVDNPSVSSHLSCQENNEQL